MALSTSRTLITKTGISTTQVFDMGGINIPGGDFNLGSAIKLGNASGIVTATSFSGSGANLTGIDATSIKHTDGNVKVQAIETGANLTGNLAVSGNATVTGTLGVGGVLTYEDVTNIDSVGVITARSDLSIADKIIHTGDTDTAIRFPAADTITAETAGSERLRITSEGKVGIGTDVFGATKLEVFEPTGTNSTRSLVRFQKDHTSTSVTGSTGAVDQYPHALILENQDNSADTGTVSLAFSKYSSGVQSQAIIAGIQESAGSMALTLNTESGNSISEKLRIESTGDIIFKNNGGDNRIERNTTSGGPYLLFHNRGTNTTDNSGVYNMGGISAAGYRDVANPGIVGSIQFERQPTSGGASSGCDIVFRTGFNGNTSHTGISEKLRLTYEGHLLPGANNQYDLGSTAKGWRNVYMNDLNLSNMNGDTNDVDGTQGSWTIQEGKDDLYIINRLNGKKFKIKMEEIS